MAVPESEIIEQLEALISDLSHIVSYKWLSRKFSVSSNAAKRLLHEFVDKHGAGLEVVYVMSGWAHENPRCFSVRLVKGSQLEGAKAGFAEGFSVHVYSVQTSVPKDPAQLWSPDYVQAEEFFNEPLDAVNCLRDNRFSGVSCSLVTRDVKAKGFHIPVRVPVPVPVPSLEQVTPPKVADQNGDKAVGSPAEAADERNDVLMKTSGYKAANNGKTKPAHVVSLTNLWGRNAATTTSPPKVTNISPEKPAVLGNAEDGIHVVEDRENDASSDDDISNFVRLRQAGKKRRVVLDDELSEDGEEGKKLDVEEVASPSKNVKGQSEERTPTTDEVQVKETQANPGEGEVKKKRKLLRTRIDDRGREVTEVVWDAEEGAAKENKAETDNPKAKKVEAPPKAEAPSKAEPPSKVEPPSNPPPPNPPKQTAKASTSKVASKPPAKSGKGGKAGPQQGSITSFFKKK